MTSNANNLVASLTYLNVERTVGWYSQSEQTTEHTITLFTTSITTTTKTFPLEQVLDISYRAFSNGNGLIYLHTTQGVFSFSITSNPTTFIRSFKKLHDPNYYM